MDVPHHMIAVADPAEQWSAARYAREAIAVVDDILSRGKLPILVGGTGLWLDAVVRGRDFAPGAAGGQVRRQLQTRLEREGIAPLLEELRQVDPEAAARLHPADEKRILRALEVYAETGETISAHNARTAALPPRYDAVWIGLQFADRADMRALIDRRVDAMAAAGLLEEVRALVRSGVPRESTALQAIGYKELLDVGEDGQGLEAGRGEAPLPAVRQAAADMAAAQPGHPLDHMGKGAGFCPRPAGFDRNPGRRWRMLAVGGREKMEIVRLNKEKGADEICRQKPTYRTCFSCGRDGTSCR